MKFFIGLALLSVAFATPMIQPVTLPEAPLPAVEGVEVQNLEFSGFGVADIRPAMIPQEIVAQLNELGEIPFDSVRIVDVAEFADDAVPVVAAEVPVSAVVVVDHVDDVLSLSEDAPVNVDRVSVVEQFEALPEESEIVADPVHFVDAPVGLDEEAPVNAERVIVVEHLDFMPVDAPAESEIVADPIHFVDAPFGLDEEAPINPERVIVVEHLDFMPVDAPAESEIVADAVRFVNTPIDIPVVHVPVFMPYPERLLDNPMWR